MCSASISPACLKRSRHSLSCLSLAPVIYICIKFKKKKEGFLYSLKHYKQKTVAIFITFFPYLMNNAIIIIIYFKIRIRSIKIKRKYTMYLNQ